MKKLLLTLFAVTILSTGYSQFTKGRILAGGSAGFSATTNKSKSGGTTTTTSKSTSIGLSPRAGYFIIDNLAIGAGLGLGTSSSKSEGSSPSTKYTSTNFELEPFVRYYLSQGIFFHGEFGVGVSKGKTTFGSTTTKSTNNTTSWTLGAGYAYFLNDNVAVEPFLGYRSYSDDNSSSKFIQSSLFLSIGLQVYLGSK